MNKVLIRNSQKMNILIDSESFENELNKDNDYAKRILYHSNSKHLNFIRSPFKTNFDSLKTISEFTQSYNQNDIQVIRVDHDKEYSETSMMYKPDFIEKVGKVFSNKKNLKTEDIRILNLFYIFVSLNQTNRDTPYLLITNNDFLLKNRLSCYDYTSLVLNSNDNLHIVTIEEAKEIIGLFLRYNKEYVVCQNWHCNRGSWYIYQFRSEVPHYHGYNYGPLASRFIYLMQSLDEIGFQYYMGVNNDTMDNIFYHFNYSISLMTGIFDSLAILTRDIHGLEYKGDTIAQRTSLNPKAGKDFLKAVKTKNPYLRKHIQDNVNFIKLVYEFRELILHRNLFNDQSQFSSKYWKMNSIRLENYKSILQYFPKNDKTIKYKPFTQSGLYNCYPYPLLEPFHFVKNLIKTLANFSDEYLKLLGFSNFIEDFNKSKNHKTLWGLKPFQRGSLTCL